MFSLGAWMLASGSEKPVMMVGIRVRAKRGDDRQRAAGADQRRPHAERPARTRPGRAGSRRRRAARRRGAPSRQQLDLKLARRPARRSRISCWNAAAIVSDLLAGREPHRHVGRGANRQHRLLAVRGPALDPVDVERRLGERADVELLGGARVGRAGALLGELVGAGRAAASSPPAPAAVGGMIPARSGSARRPSAAISRASVWISAWAAFSAAPPNMPECRSRSPVRRAHVEVDDPAGGDVEGRAGLADHAAVEDDAASAPRSSACEELDDRVAAGLLLAVAGEADVDRQLARPARAPERRASSM